MVDLYWRCIAHFLLIEFVSSNVGSVSNAGNMVKRKSDVARKKGGANRKQVKRRSLPMALLVEASREVASLTESDVSTEEEKDSCDALEVSSKDSEKDEESEEGSESLEAEDSTELTEMEGGADDDVEEGKTDKEGGSKTVARKEKCSKSLFVVKLPPDCLKLLKESMKTTHFSEMKFTSGVDMKQRAEDLTTNVLKIKSSKLKSWLPCVISTMKAETSAMRSSVLRSIKTKFEGTHALLSFVCIYMCCTNISFSGCDMR